MSKAKLFHLKNAMLGVNGLANLIGAIFVNAILTGIDRPLLPASIRIPLEKFHVVFTSSAFVFAIICTLVYERPIRQYLNALSAQSVMSEEFVTRARRRLLNEPFVLLTMDLGIWITAAIAYPAFQLSIGASSIVIQSAISDALANGLVTVTLAFFLLENVLQKLLAPHVFPEGGLYKIPKTVRIRIRIRLAALMIAGCLIPLLLILQIVRRMPLIQPDAAAALDQLRSATSANIFIFLLIAFFLTLETDSKRLEWVRAGHDPAIIYDPRSESFNELGGSGIALGVDAEWNYKDNRISDLLKGQIIFLSTDGIWEVRNKKGEMMGKEPILNIIRQKASSDAKQIIDAVFETLDEFTDGVKIEDDMTSVVIKLMDKGLSYGNGQHY